MAPNPSANLVMDSPKDTLSPRSLGTPRSNAHSNSMRDVPLEDDIEQVKMNLIEKDGFPEEPKVHGMINALRFFLLFLTNVFSWYFTNGFNGIALQSYAKTIRESGEFHETLIECVAIMTTITLIQLAAGACMGYCLLKFVISKITKSEVHLARMSQDEVIAGTLHGFGSVFTNLGFQYGSASLVQILKLLEPFETLGLSQLLTPEEGRFTFGVVSSMSIVVGSAVSLIRIRPTKPHPNSILFAVLSGLTLSLRNVLQRKAHNAKAKQLPTTQEQQQDQKANVALPEKSKTPMQKLERSVTQFTQLSFHSSILVGAMAIVSTIIAGPQMTALKAVNWRILTWHPLYNIFSMITLGFCSALTHSLLNAGKRVFAILLAILWFGEDISSATVAGLLCVASGGLWYTVESKKRKNGGWQKAVVALLVLKSLYEFQTHVKNH